MHVVRVGSVVVCGALSIAGCTGEGGGARGPSAETSGASADSGTGGDGGDGDGDDGGSDDDADETGGAPPVTGVIRTELVGHPRDGSPHFRAVDNFNDDEAITVAIDATRLGVEGECDAFVVAAKDDAQWETDPALVDVRAGGPETMTFEGGLVDNRFELTPPGALTSDAGAGLGVPYDVVLDCDQDGTLSDGDVLDGGDRPGLYRTHDVTVAGPLAVSSIEYSGGAFLGQRTFFPTDIAAMDAVPLVVVTHGWSYTYEDYDYIGEHLASYGYVVMQHETDVGDGGPEATNNAAPNTLDNTHYLLDNQATVGDGVLDGHLDASRILFTGHSTGGEAVVRAVTQLRDGSFSSPHFGYDNIKIVSSIAPVSWHPRQLVDPGDVPYHMFVAGADDDVSGAPIPSYTQSRSIYERATGDRLLTTVHGCGHGDLVSGGPLFLDTGAPGLIGREETTRVAQGYFLAMAELYLRDNEAGREFFSRSYADFHAPAIAPGVVVTSEYRQGPGDRIVLDDFETSPGGDADPLAVSSAGTAVEAQLGNAAEVLMRDNDGSFEWTGDQPSNGMTHARHDGDDPHALVFDFGAESAFYDVAVPSDAADFERASFVSLRACQGTRHPATTALAGPLSFTITLVDDAGETASVRIDGARAIPPPYARTGEGPGVGWGNEFVTVRARPLEFLGDNPALDLTAVANLRLEFGEAFGSSQGRVGLDDVELVLH